MLRHTPTLKSRYWDVEVTARTHAEVYSLTSDCVDDIFRSNPGQLEEIREKILERYEGMLHDLEDVGAENMKSEGKKKEKLSLRSSIGSAFMRRLSSVGLLDEEMHKKKKAKQEEHQSKVELRKIAHEKRLKRLRRIVKGLWRLFNTNEDSDGQSDAGSSTCSSNITQDSGVNNNNNNTKRKDSFSRMKKSSPPSIFDKRNAAHRISVLWGNVADQVMHHGNGPRRKSRLSQIRRNSMSKRLQRLLEQKKVRRASTFFCVRVLSLILFYHQH